MLTLGNVWCLGVACPWCSLQGVHGDYADARRRFAAVMSSGELRDRPHIAWAAWHAITELIERRPVGEIDAPMGAVPQPADAGAVFPHAAVHPSIFSPLLTTSSSSLHNKMKPRQPESYPGADSRQKSRQHPGSGSSHDPCAPSALHEWPQTPSWIPADRAQFEVWGEATKWIVYDEDAQRLLRCGYLRGEKVTVRSGDHVYEVNTDISCLQQVRADRQEASQSNMRRVRIVDTAEILETMY